MVKRADQLTNHQHAHRDILDTDRTQLEAAQHNVSSHLPSVSAKGMHDKLIFPYARELPQVLSAFAGLGSAPFNLYRDISFDKLHMMDLGVIRLLCDHVSSVILNHSANL